MNANRKGSALLVVLGMLSFMVISAVAFSAYMRYARLPSSFLRQTASSRLLAKAAVAKAIDEIDAAIGNMPHPGLWNDPGNLIADVNKYHYPRSGRDAVKLNRNIWRSRIYIGNRGDDDSEVERHFVKPYVNPDSDGDEDENAGTVSPLNLEALAYIPPPLVNEARYYSRRSNAAKWKKLDYDSGRYAFCAIDVSDYFDVNALSANIARSSSPAGRLSLAYLFEDIGQVKDSDTGASERFVAIGTDEKAWDDFMEKIRGKSTAQALASGEDRPTPNQSKVPLVSVADLNLAIGAQNNPGGVQSPFYEYVKQNSGSFYGNVEIDKAKRMAFVTDGWFPTDSKSEAGATYYDLSTDEGQPFERSLLEKDVNPTLRQFQGGSDTAQLIREKFGYLGLAALYDYLDQDNVPVSLAIPQVERTPMIAGITLNNVNGTLKVSGRQPHPDTPAPVGGAAEGNSRTVTQKFNYFIDGAAFAAAIQDGAVTVTVVYPFARGNDLAPRNDEEFTLEGNLAFFFSTGDCPLRPSGNVGADLHLTQDTDFTGKAVANNAVIRVPLQFAGFQNRSFKTVVSKTDMVVKDLAPLRLGGSIPDVTDFFGQTPLATVELKWQQTRSEEGGSWQPETPPDAAAVISSTCDIKAIDDEQKANVLDLNARPALTLRSAIWLRIKNKDGKTVDMVPACLADDQVFLGKNNKNCLPEESRWSGYTYPLMRFTAVSGADPCRFVLENATLSAGLNMPFSLSPASVMCADPRWNWAPESWYAPNGITVDENTWVAEVEKLLGKDCRDNDFVLTTSDAGYMQSVYELALLPRYSKKKLGEPDSGNGVYSDFAELNAVWQDFAVKFEDAKNSALMWRSYHPYPTEALPYDGAAEDDFDEGFSDDSDVPGRGFGVKKYIVSRGGGVKINPYSDNTNVLMAAFANTPCDWLAAADDTGDDAVGVPSSERTSDVGQFNKKHAFCEDNPDAQLPWNAVYSIAGNFARAVRDPQNGGNWRTAYDNLNWDGLDGEWFCGIKAKPGGTTELYDVDRKFLYGYWRECFAAQQQLFLVFVRAEPTMLGGGEIGRIPPSLGARAVALVWRDPNPTEIGANGDPNPHRTRILFYRQFE